MPDRAERERKRRLDKKLKGGKLPLPPIERPFEVTVNGKTLVLDRYLVKGVIARNRDLWIDRK